MDPSDYGCHHSGRLDSGSANPPYASVAGIRKALETGEGDVAVRVREELERIRSRQIATLTWGADLAAVAIGLDLAVLGLWMSNHTLFPFFQRWDSQSGGSVIDRAIADGGKSSRSRFKTSATR